MSQSADLSQNGYQKIQEIRKGNSSLVEIYVRGDQKVVLKTPKNLEIGRSWQQSLRKSIKMREILKNTPLPVHIPQVIESTAISMSEEYANGEKLNDILYSSLPSQEQNKIAQDIAVFLNALHQLSPQKYEDKPPRSPEPLGDGVQELIKSSISQAHWQLYRQAYTNIVQKQVGRITAYTHQDLRPDNILYNRKSAQLSILDFGESGQDKDIYIDFAPTILKEGFLPWDLTQKIVCTYNQLEKKVPAFIDIHLVRDLQIQHIFKQVEMKIYDENLPLPKVTYKLLKTDEQNSINDFKVTPIIGKIPEESIDFAAQIFNKLFKSLLEERLKPQSLTRQKSRQKRTKSSAFHERND